MSKSQHGNKADIIRSYIKLRALNFAAKNTGTKQGT